MLEMVFFLFSGVISIKINTSGSSVPKGKIQCTHVNTQKVSMSLTTLNPFMAEVCYK